MESNGDSFESLSAKWQVVRNFLTKEEIACLLCQDVPNLWLRAFLSGSLNKQKRLLMEGDFIKGYAFKEWQADLNSVRRVWILHSPSLDYSLNGDEYREIIGKIHSFSPCDKDDKRFLSVVEKPLSDAFYTSLPKSLGINGEVFLSIVELPSTHYADFTLGECYVVARRSISKRIIVLPDWATKKLCS